MRCCGTVGVLKVMRKVFVFLLPPELSLTEMLKTSVTPCGSSSLIVSSVTVNKWDTLDNTFVGVQCPVRAGCDTTASQIVQLIDCSTLGGSSDLEDKVS